MLAKCIQLIEFQIAIFSTSEGGTPPQKLLRGNSSSNPLFKFSKIYKSSDKGIKTGKVGGSSDMMMYPIVYLKRFFSKMLPKGMYQIERIEFQKCNFFFWGGAHPPSDTSLSTQARNVVLVLHFGHCLYSTPLPGKRSPGSASVCHLYHSC